MTHYETITFIQSDKVGTITLNRPEKRNALNETMCEELVDCLNLCNKGTDIKALILTGSGKIFCSGADLWSTEHTADPLPLRVERLVNAAIPVISQLRSVRVPVIAAVNGPAIGGGFAISLACDIIIAAESAKFNLQHVLIGMSPDAGVTYMLPRLVGSKRATWLMFTGEVVDALQGYEIGFINKVVEDKELLGEAKALAKRLAKGATLAIAQTKYLINMSWHENLKTQMEKEKQSVAQLADSDDFGEAISAFRDKREPKFKGR